MKSRGMDGTSCPTRQHSPWGWPNKRRERSVGSRFVLNQRGKKGGKRDWKKMRYS